MPLYEYECQQCRRHTEKRQKFSDPEITECPYCGGHLQRVISAPNIAFKGGGWYKDLYSSPKPGAAAGGESKGDGGGGAESSAKPATGGGESPGSGASNAAAPTPAAPAAAAPAATVAAPSSNKS